MSEKVQSEMGKETDVIQEAGIEEKQKEPQKCSKECPKCGAKLIEEAKFCAYCGTKLEEVQIVVKRPEVCSNCGKILKEKAKFCGACGQKVSE